MFSALKKLTKVGEDRPPAPLPMSSSLQKKFSRGVHFNMKILIKGDRNVGKSCLLQRLQGGPFTEEYAPTDQIQVAPIHWAYKNTDYIVKVEVWEVVDKGRTKKKPPLGLKLENQATPTPSEDDYETPVLDATFLDVYKNASGVILMLDITKPWTFDYVVKELTKIPADLPVVILGNHCDMQHHRQVHPHHIEQAISQAKSTRSAPIRYAESSMRNGFGLRLLHKFLSVPFLRLQKTSLLEQLQRNQKDMEEIENELDEFQKSPEAHYDTFLDRLANKRRQSSEPEPRVATDRSPSIVLGAGKPIIPPNVNPLATQYIDPLSVADSNPDPTQNNSVQTKQSQYVSPDFIKNKQSSTSNILMDMPSPSNLPSMGFSESGIVISMPGIKMPGRKPPQSKPSDTNNELEDFYAGTLDSSFLDDGDVGAGSNDSKEVNFSASDEDNVIAPKVEKDDLDYIEDLPPLAAVVAMQNLNLSDREIAEKTQRLKHQLPISGGHMYDHSSDWRPYPMTDRRRSPEGGEDSDTDSRVEREHKKKKSKDKSARRERKKQKKAKEKQHPQQGLLMQAVASMNSDDYDPL